MTRAYLQKAEVRLQALEFFRQHGAYSDVVREAQEMVELLLKAVLRAIGAEVPKVHDVGRALVMHKDQLPAEIVDNLDRLRLISKRLRKERELSFYGAEDFVPTEEYDDADAEQAIREAAFVYKTVRGAFDIADGSDTDKPHPHK